MTTPLEPIVEVEQAFEPFLNEQELRPRSIKSYAASLTRFPSFLDDTKRSHVIADFDADILADYNTWLKGRYEPATVRSYLTAMSRLMEWLDNKDLLPDIAFYDRMARRINGARGRPHRGYKRRPTDPAVVSLTDYFMAVPLPTKRGARRLAVLRNRILIPMLYDTAMRVSELVALTRQDVMDGRADEVELVDTKGGVPRIVLLSQETKDLIRAYCAERADDLKAPLIASHGRDKGTALTTSHVWLLIKKAALALGLYENTSPHSLRHRKAQDLLDAGMPLELIQALLGHKSPETTRVVYAPYTNKERMKEAWNHFGQTPSEAANKARREN